MSIGTIDVLRASGNVWVQGLSCFPTQCTSAVFLVQGYGALVWLLPTTGSLLSHIPFWNCILLQFASQDISGYQADENV